MTRARSLSVILSTTILALMTPGAAEARPSSWGQCPDDYFCAWENADGTGHFAKFQIGSEDLSRAIGGYVFNDQISSVWNRTTDIWCLWPDAHWVGTPLRISLEWQGPVGPRYNFDQKVSSLQPCKNIND